MYAPGESPFHVRGSTYLGIRDHVKATLPGGLEAVFEAMPQGPHRSFVEQAFTADGWYDALTIRPLTEIIAKLEQRSWEDSLRARASDLARREHGVLGRVRMIASSPEKIAEKLQLAALERFDFGQAEIVETGRGLSKVAYHEVPQPLGAWLIASLDGHASVAISNAGGKQPKLNSRLIPQGRRGDMGLVDVRVELSWSR
ncbi:hypothetical protein [Enhygromyxa salina]|uniref:Uncharacterized protein n=1 Tax=Enhygromyxa salina TaxID=215803 RepID=A0A2S9XTM2_9BACT|nr:hypothetical protein [Enhygromyxa salina]PRP96216.1 hypothetical protein ENSA7_70300 [Enhygromyxa salina]